MEGRSAATVGLISSEDIAGDYFCLSQKKSPGREAGARIIPRKRQRSVALTEQLQQQREQVDEVQVKRQRAGNRRTLRYVTALRGIAVDVIVLQPLGIPGGEAGKYQHADHGHYELQHRAGEEDVDQARDD